ncbi:SIMPL domain-containing protein [Tenacibaculum xiamenense]|uniref:SIMPL domain-containing protein n=1 Tax=Tenacibaculum xiamenense TaxID=1261553 RepID=UPI00389548A3
MRKNKVLQFLLLIVFLFLGITTATSQEKRTQIKVQGRAVHVDANPLLKAVISISDVKQYYSGQSDTAIISFEEVKQKYVKQLQSKGISWSMFSEKPYEFGYEVLKSGIDIEGRIYEFQTSSVEQMRLFLNIHTSGLNILKSVALIRLNEKEKFQLYKKALDAAEYKAKLIARAMGKTLDKVLEVSDNRLDVIPIENYIYYDRPIGEYIYNLEVIYSVQ